VNRVDIDEDNADRSQLGKGEYASYFEVGSDYVSFYVDCGQVGQKDQPNRLYSRIITSPIGAQRLLATLSKALKAYAVRFGVIRDETGMPVHGADEE
jgi:hypothetical protein